MQDGTLMGVSAARCGTPLIAQGVSAKEKHMADDVPNEEQVKVCRDRIHEKVFGKFFTRLVNVRDSAQFKFTDCLNEAGNEYE